METLTERLPSPHPLLRVARRGIAVVLAVLVCAPVLAAPPAVVAAARSAVPDSAALGPREAEKGGAQQPEADGAQPSVHYLESLAHEADVIDFEPGERVTVPFRPRPGDDWEVDGQSPRALPAGKATGLEMRASPGDAVLPDPTPSPVATSAPPDASPAGPTTDPAGPAESPAIGVVPATYRGAATDESTAAAPISAGGLRREVFGFLPYWEVGDTSTTLDWRTLSTVAYFSVGCLSSGGLDKYDSAGTTSTGWGGWTSSKMTSIINAAHQNQTRVVLTISCFAWSSSGATRQAALLGSATARANLAKEAAAAVRDRGADGINLDFEPIVSGYADEFTLLVRAIRSELNKIAPGYQLTFDTLGSIGNQPIVDATAPGGADAVLIMGYDYRTASSSVAGSISPLTGPRYDLTDTVNAYTAKISPSKVILGVPYYGRAWSTPSDALNATNISGTKYGASAAPTYDQAYDFAATYGRRWDSVEQTPWVAYRKQTCTTTYGCVTSWRQLYYDDATSLKLRYDLVNRTSLRGAGIWALGYDGAHPELRQAIADKFLADKTPPIVGIANLSQTQRDEGFRVAWSSWDDSSIAGYDVQVAVDGGAWTPWLTGTTVLSSIYLGDNGRTYAFRIRATDVHGNVSPWNESTSATATGVPTTIEAGSFATVLVDGLRMRSTPSTGGSVMTTLSAGDVLKVIAGPVAGEGYAWYQVSGPVRQWAPVDAIQVGGWVAASGNGATNAAPRRPVYATRLTAGIVNLLLNSGGARFLTPNGDGDHDVVHLSWTNARAFDSLALRVYRTDGTFVGDVALGSTSSGPHAYDWNGRVNGATVAPGAYVLQLQGIDGGATFSAPSASPVSPAQILLAGVTIGNVAHTSVVSFKSSPASPTRSTTISYALSFGGPIGAFSRDDLVRGGTATNCVIGTPTGAGASWSVPVTGCSSGTLVLSLKGGSVHDAVGNWGPSAQVNGNVVVIDRTAPKTATPRISLRAGVALRSTSKSCPLPALLTWSATDAGGAGIATYDVARSVDGGRFAMSATGLVTPSLAITLTPGHSYRYEVRTRDRAGNVGAWQVGPTIRAGLTQQSSGAVTWRGSWAGVTDTRFSGGSVRWSGSAGASVSYTFTGRAVAWITTTAPAGGVAKVYLDGVLVTTVDTNAAATSFLRVGYARTWPSSGTHTLRIVVAGTRIHPRVYVDAFEVLR